MHLKAINTIIHDGSTYKPGAIIADVSEADAKVLIAGGFAVESDEAPAKPAKGKASKAEKAPAPADEPADEPAAAAAEAGAESDGN